MDTDERRLSVFICVHPWLLYRSALTPTCACAKIDLMSSRYGESMLPPAFRLAIFCPAAIIFPPLIPSLKALKGGYSELIKPGTPVAVG